jgi:hypothetical protein
MPLCDGSNEGPRGMKIAWTPRGHGGMLLRADGARYKTRIGRYLICGVLPHMWRIASVVYRELPARHRLVRQNGSW